jgi:tetratricopeptide (TPR) repeat protein
METAGMTSTTTSAAAAPRRLNLRWYFERQWLRVALLCIGGVVARFPALSGQPIWDDDYLVSSNPFIKSPVLILETFRHSLFPDSLSTHYRPVQNISYCIDYFFWKGDPLGYHISNLFWHVGSAILLYFLVSRLLASLGARPTGAELNADGRFRRSVLSAAAFLIALVWVVHPVHSAAVDYISGRADSLACFFACGAWLLYLRARQTVRPVLRVSLYSGAALSALLALTSRESGCTWLMVFLLHLFVFERSIKLRARLIVLTACLSILGLYIGLRHLPGTQSAAAGLGGSAAPVRVVLMLRALGDYGRLLLWPGNLHMERSVEAPEATLGNEGWRHAIGMEYLSILGVLFGAVLLIGVLRKGRAQPIRALGATWFIAAFLPTSNIIELNATVAEHWLYLPSIGFLIFAAGCVMDFRPVGRRLGVALACIAVVGLSLRSVVRSRDWVNSETFYRHSLAAGAAKPRIALNLGLILIAKGDYAKAEPLLRRVVAVYPNYPIAVNALAHALFRAGKLDEANHFFQVAKEAADKNREEYPRTWIAVLNLAHMRYREHDLSGALALIHGAQAQYPNTWELISFESEVLRQLHGPAAALPSIEAFARDNWWHCGAAIAKGKLYSELGRYNDAENAFRHASRLDFGAVEALNLITLLNLRQNHLDVAITAQRRAISRQPDQPRQYLILSDILEKMGRHDEAQAALTEVRRLQMLVKSETTEVVAN